LIRVKWTAALPDMRGSHHWLERSTNQKNRTAGKLGFIYCSAKFDSRFAGDDETLRPKAMRVAAAIFLSMCPSVSCLDRHRANGEGFDEKFATVTGAAPIVVYALPRSA